jgi:hypothetical protein
MTEVESDLGVAVERAARPGSAYRLRAAYRLQNLDDESGALSDLESFAEWSTTDELQQLRTDSRFRALRENPRFRNLFED